ncbi:MAG: glycogen synthase GlgA [Clostridia bacterium]|nr:glycogen synthase GlgA [Clostridia bacterium]
MKILFAASEGAPYIKSGGLGDVIEALPSELSKNPEYEVSVVLPYYKSLKENPDFNPEFIKSFYVSIAYRDTYVGVFTLKNKNVTYYFIDNEFYFLRDGGYYGHFDDGERFAYYSKAILASFAEIGYFPDIIHLNDWQTATIPVFLKACYSHIEAYSKIKTVFTIHNIEYQGRMPMDFSENIMELSGEWKNVLTYDGAINFMKGAIVASDKITTVSRTYAHEIKYAYFSHGLDPILRENEYKLTGIVNGINTNLYSPKNDKNIPKKFSPTNPSGKYICKEELQKELGLEVRNDVPIVSMVTRLVSHKGLELVECVIHEMMKNNIQLVVLGTGDSRFEEMFRFAEYYYPGRLKALITFNSALASRIYAGSDLFLMPSKSEPCGLSQLIAMRYGTIPIVRETGGLFDTVPALNTETLEGKGFTFKLFNAHDMLNAVERAAEFWHDEAKREKHIKALMKYDSSWSEPVKEYGAIYNSLV